MNINNKKSDQPHFPIRPSCSDGDLNIKKVWKAFHRCCSSSLLGKKEDSTYANIKKDSTFKIIKKFSTSSLLFNKVVVKNTDEAPPPKVPDRSPPPLPFPRRSQEINQKDEGVLLEEPDRLPSLPAAPSHSQKNHTYEYIPHENIPRGFNENMNPPDETKSPSRRRSRGVEFNQDVTSLNNEINTNGAISIQSGKNQEMIPICGTFKYQGKLVEIQGFVEGDPEYSHLIGDELVKKIENNIKSKDALNRDRFRLCVRDALFEIQRLLKDKINTPTELSLALITERTIYTANIGEGKIWTVKNSTCTCVTPDQETISDLTKVEEASNVIRFRTEIWKDKNNQVIYRYRYRNNEDGRGFVSANNVGDLKGGDPLTASIPRTPGMMIIQCSKSVMKQLKPEIDPGAEFSQKKMIDHLSHRYSVMQDVIETKQFQEQKIKEIERFSSPQEGAIFLRKSATPESPVDPIGVAVIHCN